MLPGISTTNCQAQSIALTAGESSAKCLRVLSTCCCNFKILHDHVLPSQNANHCHWQVWEFAVSTPTHTKQTMVIKVMIQTSESLFSADQL
jgi:hypothetical protein